MDSHKNLPVKMKDADSAITDEKSQINSSKKTSTTNKKRKRTSKRNNTQPINHRALLVPPP